MEEDIEILERKIDEFMIVYNCCSEDVKPCYADDICIDEVQAIEHLIKSYKELEEYYEEQNEVNAKFIPVSLVEETIEEYTKLLKNCNRFSDLDRIKAINERILAYKELLEKR